MSKKLYVGILLALAFSFAASAAYAKTAFKDVGENYWAKNDISTVVEKKLILSYADGTFKPNKELTMIDMLVIVARVLGVNDPKKQSEVVADVSAYKKVLSKYSVNSKKEISLLLAQNVLSKDELDMYITSKAANASLTRYQAAIMLTKILGKEKEVKNKTFVILPFDDSSDIPFSAKAHVEYMVNEKIISGVTAKKFMPNSHITRAQMAGMLVRIIARLEPKASAEKSVTPAVSTNKTTPAIPSAKADSAVTGIISLLDASMNLIAVKSGDKVKSLTLLDTTPIKIDNLLSAFKDLERGDQITVKMSGDQVVEVNAASRAIVKTVSGPVVKIVSSPVQKIFIKQGSETISIENEYVVDEYVTVQKNGNASSLSALKTDDYATLNLLSNNKAARITAEDAEKTVSGVVENVAVSDKVVLTLKTNGASTPYEVLSSVVVSRNNTSALLKDIKPLDQVTVILRYGKVKQITASSQKRTIEGTIESIYISKDPKISIKVGDLVTEYSLARDASIAVSGITSQIYDLRIGASATFNMDGDVVVGVFADKKVETLQVEGTIKLINLNLGVITLVNDKTSKQSQIYTSQGSVKVNDIIKGTTINLSELKEGYKIIAYGKSDQGVFVTTLIVVMSQE
jgi:hypothetical protein